MLAFSTQMHECCGKNLGHSNEVLGCCRQVLLCCREMLG